MLQAFQKWYLTLNGTRSPHTKKAKTQENGVRCNHRPTESAAVEAHPDHPTECRPRGILATSLSPTSAKRTVQRPCDSSEFRLPPHRPRSGGGFRCPGDLPRRTSILAWTQSPLDRNRTVGSTNRISSATLAAERATKRPHFATAGNCGFGAKKERPRAGGGAGAAGEGRRGGGQPDEGGGGDGGGCPVPPHHPHLPWRHRLRAGD